MALGDSRSTYEWSSMVLWPSGGDGFRKRVGERRPLPSVSPTLGGWIMNRCAFLKYAGALATVAILALYASPADTADSSPVTVLVTYQSSTGNTEKMAQGVADGAKAVSGTSVILKRVSEVAVNDLLTADAVVVGSPVYFGSMSGEVKTFFDNWTLKFDLFRDRKMRNKVGGAFATGGSGSNGKEVTMLTILGAMLINQMIVVSGGGGFGASATTGPDSPGIDEKEVTEARELGRRVAEVGAVVKRGSGK
jgi:NAD(P)H dehydrogenase (quinone)